MSTYTKLVDQGIVLKEVREFGLVDGKGREIGNFIKVRKVEFFPQDDGVQGGYHYPAGVMFETYVHPTRNGETFGALQSRNYYPSFFEAMAAVEKTVAASRKRYAKKVGA